MKCQQLEDDLKMLSQMQDVEIDNVTTSLEGDRAVVIMEIEGRKYRYSINYVSCLGVKTFDSDPQRQRKAALQLFSMHWNQKLSGGAK